MKTPTLLWLVLAPLWACSPGPEAPAADGDPTHGDEPADELPPGVLEVPQSVRANLGIAFAGVEARRVASTLRLPGAFELEPLARHEYRMTLPGTVELLVDHLSPVEEDQPLFRFRSPAWPELLHEIITGEQQIDSARSAIRVAEARLAEAEARLGLAEERIAALARADFKRADLEAEAAELRASLPRLEAERRHAETQLSNAQRTREHALHRAAVAAGVHDHELEREVQVGDRVVPLYETIDAIEVQARSAGVVDSLAVTHGSFVEPPAPVLSVVDPSRVRFRALALQADLPKLIAPGTARIVPPRTPGFPAGEAVPAEVSLGLEAHPRERTFTLFAKPGASAPWVREGVSAFLEVEVETSEGPALAIPSEAIVRDGLARVFFRRDPRDPGRVLRVEADLGPSDGRWTVVRSGLVKGDEVVVDGAYELQIALARRGGAPTSGHVHADGSVHEDH